MCTFLSCAFVLHLCHAPCSHSNHTIHLCSTEHRQAFKASLWGLSPKCKDLYLNSHHMINAEVAVPWGCTGSSPCLVHTIKAESLPRQPSVRALTACHPLSFSSLSYLSKMPKKIIFKKEVVSCSRFLEHTLRLAPVTGASVGRVSSDNLFCSDSQATTIKQVK